ncbi:MAG: glycosyltransferase, partial [Gammaproteobacteria bacterium AqS3]|nr:glycosyltransferase [Gammaproteobacteria bacterium AqS3]
MSDTPRCRIAILAAGTGGHVLPALEVAQGLRAEGAHIEWLGAGRDLERRLVDAAGFPYTDIGAIGFVGRGALGQLSSLLLNGLALLRAIVWMQRRRPDIVFGFGGYICVSGGLAAHLCRIPLILHEQNAVPGRANRLCARWARIGFEGIPGGFSGLVETHPSGNPVRPDIAALPEPGRRYAERGTAPLRLLVLGGSSGAEQLNQALPALLGGRSDLEVR